MTGLLPLPPPPTPRDAGLIPKTADATLESTARLGLVCQVAGAWKE
jgi:hypothetical protein